MSLVRRALRKIALPEEEKTDRWSNEDIRPVPPERQLWGKFEVFPPGHGRNIFELTYVFCIGLY
jgi:cytosine/uracil/thiamine/allantoin permease